MEQMKQNKNGKENQTEKNIHVSVIKCVRERTGGSQMDRTEALGRKQQSRVLLIPTISHSSRAGGWHGIILY